MLIAFLCSSCYSFKGTSIPQGVKTYYIPDVSLVDLSAPPETPIDFREKLRGKIRRQSNLNWTDTDPQVEFICTISRFDVLTASAGADAIVEQNTLKITVNVEYVTNYDEEEGWEKSFTETYNFDANEDLSQVQNQYIDNIFDRITEQIFLQAFAQW